MVYYLKVTRAKLFFCLRCLQIGIIDNFDDLTIGKKLNPSEHTTLFQRPSDVRNIQKTLNRRPNNVLC